LTAADVLRARVAFAGVLAQSGCSTSQLVAALRREFAISRSTAFRVIRRTRSPGAQ